MQPLWPVRDSPYWISGGQKIDHAIPAWPEVPRSRRSQHDKGTGMTSPATAAAGIGYFFERIGMEIRHGGRLGGQNLR